MARLVRATHDLGACEKERGAAARNRTSEIMGPPDKPGDDEHWEELGRLNRDRVAGLGLDGLAK